MESFEKRFTGLVREEVKKPIYPKVMWVSNTSKYIESYPLKRVVFMEKNGCYLAWINAETLEQAEDQTEVSSWLYAKDIESDEKINLLQKADELIKKAEELKEAASKL